MKKIATILSLILFIALSVVKTVGAVGYEVDNAFGMQGRVQTTFGNEANVSKILHQNDGKILVVGYIWNGSNLDWAIVRYLSNGETDPMFGNNGIVVRDFGENDFLGAISTLSNGKILIGGYASPPGTPHLWTIARLNADGSFDTSFDGDGVVMSADRGTVNGVVAQQDGKIIAAGYFQGITNGSDDVSVVRYFMDGVLDDTFGNSGKVLTDISGSNDRGNALGVQQDGKILVLGDYDAGGNDEIFVVRYSQTGNIDSSFAQQGKLLTQFGVQSFARDLVIQEDGKIVAVGGIYYGNNSGDTFVFRLNPDGDYDTGFDSDGKIIKSFSMGWDYASSVDLIDDKLIIGGADNVGDKRNFALRRLNDDGSDDANFGNNGSIVYIFNNNDNGLQDVSIFGNTITAVGVVNNGNYSDWGLVKLSGEVLPPSSLPLLKQANPLWASDVYDNANLWSSGATGMDRWGCAVTSATMVLQYHNITKLPSGLELTPGSLNNYLKSIPDGYIRNGATNWIAISVMTKLSKIFNLGFGFSALEYDRGSNSTSQLVEDLANNIPNILETDMGQGNRHFIVASGVKNSSSFYINDPGFDRADLSAYNDTFLSSRRFVPSNTDLSYLMFVIDPTVNISLKDANNNSIGEEILEGPVGDVMGLLTNSRGALKVIYFKKPQSGNYRVEVSSTQASSYKLDAYLYDKGGNVNLSSHSGNVVSGKVESYNLVMNKESISSTKFSKVTFDYVKEQIKLGYAQKKIKNVGIYTSLLIQLEIARKSQSRVVAGKILDIMVSVINNKKKVVDTAFASNLISDILLLKNSL